MASLSAISGRWYVNAAISGISDREESQDRKTEALEQRERALEPDRDQQRDASVHARAHRQPQSLTGDEFAHLISVGFEILLEVIVEVAGDFTRASRATPATRWPVP